MMKKLSLAFTIGIVAAGLTGCAANPAKNPGSAPQAQKSAEGDAINAAAKPEQSRPARRNETIVATGYAVINIQNHKVPAQQRLLAIRAAKIDAYRGLAEQVYGLQLDASTTIADMTVLNDKFRTRVEGVIYGATLSSITPVNNDTYEVTLTLDGNVVNDIRLLYLDTIASTKHR